jgi:hypothetical protein
MQPAGLFVGESQRVDTGANKFGFFSTRYLYL